MPRPHRLSGGVSIWPKVSPPRHADMLLVSIFQLFYKDPDLKHVGMTREGETAALPGGNEAAATKPKESVAATFRSRTAAGRLRVPVSARRRGYTAKLAVGSFTYLIKDIFLTFWNISSPVPMSCAKSLKK